jgi:hypothetical protein
MQEQILGSKRSLRGIARNPIYKGLYVWGKHKVRRSADGARSMRLTNKDDHLVCERPDLRIVDDELWDSVQEKLSRSGSVPLNQRRRPTHLLSGLLFCGICGQSYRMGSYGRVRCSGRYEMGTCDNNRSVLRTEIETAVLDALAEALICDELIDNYVREYRETQRREHADGDRISQACHKREATLERERAHLLEKVANGKAVGAVGDYIIREIEKRTDEIESLRAQAGAPSLPPLLHDANEITERFRAQIADLRGSLSGDGHDAIQARTLIRTLLDRVEVSPIGERQTPKRGLGPVMLKVTGRLASFVDFAEGASSYSVLLSSNVPTQQDLTYRQWTLTASVRNPNPHKGRHREKPHIISALLAANKPLSQREIVQIALTATGEAPTPAAMKQKGAAVAACLSHLKEEGIVVMSNVPVDHYRQQFWVLSERQAEFWPSGPPTQDGFHTDTQRVLAALRETGQPLTCRDIVFKTLSVEGLSPKRVSLLGTRVRGCLEHLSTLGTVRQVPMPERGSRIKGWVLVSPPVPDPVNAPQASTAAPTTLASRPDPRSHPSSAPRPSPILGS